MFQEYYKSKAKYYSNKLKKFNNENLDNIKDFNDAFKKFSEFKYIYDKTKYYIDKLPYGYISDENCICFQIKTKLDDIYNKSIISALKSSTENESLIKLENMKTNLNNSYGSGLDNYISEYQQNLYNIIEKHKIIYNNYKNNLKEDLTINFDYSNDPLLKEIVDFAIETGKVSASLLQRRFKLGYNKVARIIDKLEADGLIGPQNGSKPRDVLIKYDESNNYTLNKIIDFAAIYGVDYELIRQEKEKQQQKEKEKIDNFNRSYVNMAQSYFDEKGLKIKFNKTKRIKTSDFSNILFTNTMSENVESLVNSILSMSVPNELKLVLIDYSQINLFEYNGLSNLLVPVITNYNDAKNILDNLELEMNRRYDLFLAQKVKKIDAYNEKVNDTENLPYIIVVINEIFEMLKFENSREVLSKLLLNCKKAGIIFMCFSKFNKKNIQLMMLEDLFEIHNGYSNSYLDYNNIINNTEIDKIDNYMDGFDFEKYTGQLLKANGFTKVEVTQSSSDYGVDVIAYKEEIKYAIQCKKYSTPVGIKAVQEVIGSKSMNNCHVAVVLTNNSYTKSAKELAEKNNVLLWDRDKLIELIDNMNK